MGEKNFNPDYLIIMQNWEHCKIGKLGTKWKGPIMSVLKEEDSQESNNCSGGCVVK